MAKFQLKEEEGVAKVQLKKGERGQDSVKGGGGQGSVKEGREGAKVKLTEEEGWPRFS